MNRRSSGYELFADRYAAEVDTKPHNAYYERPAMLSLLPRVEGLHVLDAGCGSGWYTKHLLDQGAKVTAVDVTPRFVELTRQRVGAGARVLQADLAEPLEFAADREFDLVVCALVLHYLRDWTGALREFRRVLRPSGLLVFSTHHPFMDWQQFEREDYFATELLEDEWGTGTVTFYRRPLTSVVEALSENGFVIERLLEPQPLDEYRQANPQWYERLMTSPWFLLIRARRLPDEEDAAG